jgi:hypothetical protein
MGRSKLARRALPPSPNETRGITHLARPRASAGVFAPLVLLGSSSRRGLPSSLFVLCLVPGLLASVFLGRFVRATHIYVSSDHLAVSQAHDCPIITTFAHGRASCWCT